MEWEIILIKSLIIINIISNFNNLDNIININIKIYKYYFSKK